MKKLNLVRALLYTVLALMIFILARPFGVSFNWALYAFALTSLVLLILWCDFEARHYDARMISLLAVMCAFTVVSRQIIHGVEFSPVFFLVIITGYMFGFAPGFAVGSTVMLVSNFFLGQGPWTMFQMVGLGLCAALASFLPKTKNTRLTILYLGAYSVASAYLYGFFMDFFSWIVFVPTHTINSYLGVALAGMVANTSRAVGNAFFVLALYKPVHAVLERFKRRFTIVYLR